MHNKPSKKRSITLLLLGMFALLLLLFFTHSFPPSYIFSFYVVSLSALFPFFILFFLTLFGIVGFIFKSPLQGILAGLFSIAFLILRLFSFTHWFFTLVLVAFFVAVELFFMQAKE